jgi:glycosyltransferase involved in cell wall biosynthesis
MNESVSIIIPAYNAEKTIARAVDSVLAQTYSPVEVIVVDDGSTDGTRGICESYGDKITYIHQTNKGVSAARNKGIQTASGEYIGFLDADDWYLPVKLEKMMPLFKKYPGTDLASCAFWIEKKEKTVRSPVAGKISNHESLLSLFSEMAKRNIIINTNTVIIQRSVFREVGYFNETFHFGEDLEFWARIGGRKLTAYIDEPLCVYNRRLDSSACIGLPTDQHGLDFLYGEEQILKYISPEYRGDYRTWRDNDLFGRLCEGLLRKNKDFVAQCSERLRYVPARIDKLSLFIPFCPVCVWPILTRIYLKLYRPIKCLFGLKK